MLRDNFAQYDGLMAVPGGMDSGNAPNTIGRAKVAFARNVTFRGGYPHTRPGWRKRTLRFDSETTQTRFEDGLYQGAGGFEPFYNPEKLIASVSGRIFSLEVNDRYLVTELSANLSPVNSSLNPKIWSVQAEDFFVIQDGDSAALIYDGVELRRVDPSSVPPEIPVCKAMEYANGRIWGVKPHQMGFVAGDLNGGDQGTGTWNYRDSVLKFSENEYLAGGGEFGVPVSAGKINAIRAIANLDTSLGQGPVQIGMSRGMFSVNAPFDRQLWNQVEYPIETVSLMGSGPRSQESTILVNGDIWFRAGDGIRSFQVARRDFNSWVNTPMSSEIDSVLRFDNDTLLEHCSAAAFDNRYLVTVAPFRVLNHGICWRGMAAMDFHNVSGVTSRSAPVWDGLWTGLNILQIVQLKDRCFMFALNASDKIELWELTRNEYHDNRTTRIAAFIDTPLFGFQDNGQLRKELTTGDLWFSKLSGTVDFNIQFRPDQYPAFIDWDSWSVDAKDDTCPESCGVITSQPPQYRPRKRLPLPSDGCNSKVAMSFRHCYEAQARIAWTGQAELNRFRMVAHQVQEDTAPYCEADEAVDASGVNACPESLFGYSSG